MSARTKNGRGHVEASDLLSELQAEVESAAAAEVAQLAAARRARVEAEADAIRREDAARKADVQARLEAEAYRRAIRAEALAPKPAPAPAPEAVVPVSAPAPVHATFAPSAPLEPTPPTHRLGFYGIAIALPLLCVSAVVGALVYQQHRDRPQATVLQAPTLEALDIRRAYTVIPPVELTPSAPVALPEVIPVVHKPAVAARKPRPKARPRPAAKPKPMAKPAEDDFDIDLSNFGTAE